MFRASDGTQLAKVTAADAAAGDKFGGSVAIFGDTIVIGAKRQGRVTLCDRVCAV